MQEMEEAKVEEEEDSEDEDDDLKASVGTIPKQRQIGGHGFWYEVPRREHLGRDTRTHAHAQDSLYNKCVEQNSTGCL